MDDAIWLATNVIKALILPPGLLLIVALLAWFAPAKRRWVRWTGLASMALLVLLSMQAVGTALLVPLEAAAPPLAASRLAEMKGTDTTIVILGGGRRLGARDEQDGEALSTASLERCVAGARLARASDLPVVVSGGMPADLGRLTEAQLMARVLRDDLGVSRVRTENRSYDTQQNALYVAELLGGAKGKRIVLVTHFYHMAGAEKVFAAQGFEVVRAPMGHRAGAPRIPLHFLPSWEGLRDSNIASREYMRALWYAVRL